jgi:hypothetical protein
MAGEARFDAQAAALMAGGQGFDGLSGVVGGQQFIVFCL